MRLVKLIISLMITTAWLVTLNTRFGMIPELGKFLSPFTGYLQNAEAAAFKDANETSLRGLQQKVSVHFDEKRVPHVFAENEHDLYFMQGYLTARDRLWQMEFISYVASGRISELVGEKALELDRTQRRMGIPWSAASAIAQLNTDPELKVALDAYAEGVNTYIASLNERSLPLEYKLLGYVPQKWEPYQSALLLKFMAKMLASQETDFELTNTLKLFGKETVDLLFPDFPEGIDPIMPVGTVYDFPKDTFEQVSPLVPEYLLTSAKNEKSEYEHLGSNNWAVHGSKTKSGKPILCNDPHLQLQLPSIWYEMQLSAPGVNAYGVALPGSPCIIIGFNENAAWGVTNAGMDVKDWYVVEFKDAVRDSYLFDGKYLPTQKIVEAIRIKGKEIFYDTVVYTHHGPVMYDEKFTNGIKGHSFAMRWTAHDPSNELRTFYLLNRAKNYDDYMHAISFFECPAQNFVFASKSGDIAICQMGKYPLKFPEQGKYISDGTSSRFDWKGFIPQENISVLKNPERGFVSSANQHPTDSTYPHYYNTGYGYEYYRNRRINMQLSAMEQVTPEDMMRLQTDNFNLPAKEVLPFLLTEIEQENLTAEENNALNELLQWNFYNEADLTAPSIFVAFWDTLYHLIFDEFSNGSEFFGEDEKPLPFRKPASYNTANFIINYPEHALMDIKKTPEKENLKMLVNMAFKHALATLNERLQKGEKLNWAAYQNTTIGHWAMIAPFNEPVKTGGYKYAVNAISKQHGPSWRMVVSLEDSVRAWGVYPGGQSGNMGSANATVQLSKWSNGEYYELVFLKNAADASGKVVHSKIFNP